MKLRFYTVAYRNDTEDGPPWILRRATERRRANEFYESAMGSNCEDISLSLYVYEGTAAEIANAIAGDQGAAIRNSMPTITVLKKADRQPDGSYTETVTRTTTRKAAT